MKKLFKILIIFLCFSTVYSISFSITSSERQKIIAQIKKDYDTVNSNIKNYEVKTVKLTEKHKPVNLNAGDTVIFYNKKGIPQKMTVNTNINNNKAVIEFYAKNEKVYFVVETILEKNGEKLTNSEVTRYYFSPQGKIVREMYNSEINDDVEYEEGEPDITEIFIEMNAKLNGGYERSLRK